MAPILFYHVSPFMIAEKASFFVQIASFLLTYFQYIGV